MQTSLRLIAYGPDGYSELELSALAELDEARKDYPCAWLDIAGFNPEEIGEMLVSQHGVHRLAVADLSNPRQRPKAEDFGDHVFITTRMVEPLPDNEFHIEPFYMWLFDDLIITVQSTPFDCLDRIRLRIRQGGQKVRIKPVDYLLYQLLDGVVQGYFPILEDIGDRLDELEDGIVAKPNPSHLSAVHREKVQLLELRRSIWPQRELVLALSRDELAAIRNENRAYFRDTYDHVVQAIDLTEYSREICGDLADLYMGSMSNRMNDVMKVLTMISTVFIPLSFIAGVYGMNFDPQSSPYNMPELSAYWGYPAVLGVMGAVGLGLLYLFWRWGWLTGDRR